MHLPIFYSALMLTAVNLLLRFVGTSFQVYLSGRIGAAGVGLLQLVMSVNGFAVVAGVAGIHTAAMYLTAEVLGRKQKNHVSGVLSGCFLYSILCSGIAAVALFVLAPALSEHWISNPRTTEALRLFAFFLPALCLVNVMTGYFTAASRIGTLAAVEVAEQLLSMVVTILALQRFAGNDAVRACQCIILGNCCAACFTLLCLVFLHLKEGPPVGPRLPMGKRLADTAVPLALADVLKSGLSTTENLMVPKRLALNLQIQDPLAAFGTVSGMVFPILMFPACILYGLAELLIPELARCAAAGSRKRICYLVKKSLRIALIYGIFFAGLEYLLADWLCRSLYGNLQAGIHLKRYSLLIPMLYCDAMTDAMTKGLGQQKKCVRYNIFTSALDVVFLWLLLPVKGMTGYLISFAVTHLINFLLSLRLLLKITGQSVSCCRPALAFCALLLSLWGAGFFPTPIPAALAYCLLLGSLLCLFQITGREDVLWLKSLLCRK